MEPGIREIGNKKWQQRDRIKIDKTKGIEDYEEYGSKAADINEPDIKAADI